MAVPSKTTLRLAAGAVAAYAVWVGAQRNRGYQAVADVQYTKYGQDTYQKIARQHYYQGITGNDVMDKWAHKLRAVNAYGPMNMFPRLKKWELKTKAFVNNVLLTPESLLGVAALYVAGMKPHQVITKPLRWLWQDGGMREGLTKVGDMIRNYRPRGLTQKLGKVTRFAFTLPGLLLGLGAAVLAWRFNRVYEGVERADFFDPGGQRYTPWLNLENSMIL